MSGAPVVCPPPQEEGLSVLPYSSDPEAALQKARKDTAVVPSIHYIDLANSIPGEAQSVLNQYRSEVLSYRSWASLRWWATVDKSQNLPQDDSLVATAKRAGCVARVANADISRTPWLQQFGNSTVQKHISSPVSDLHPTLIGAVLEGFAAPHDEVLETLERVVEQVVKAIEVKAHIPDSLSQLIILQRYEWIPEIRDVKSYTRTILFDITDDTVITNIEKRSQEHIEFDISYNEHESLFNKRGWEQVSRQLDSGKREFRDYVQENTVYAS
ncbi:hypothetical protein BDV38DRAFT_285269 [Aspergillus pseudotamarii]|uniref:Uncharacterized protein n=1 Tax=Aspergillus pseudotamarii TaxID=132259 RepID=A0A5N6SME7_ASPPS|nr:uncharacterized protein BDV38DRAFT_285269 [Aspergillus pseudotamarii]KAE8135067.1 hypothetical protein BDV38DRAFT_285269 [Aspergillus pseudotamarii]